MAEPGIHTFCDEVTENPWVWGAVALCTVLLVATVYLPGLPGVLSTIDPGGAGGALVAGASVTPVAVARIIRAARTGRTQGLRGPAIGDAARAGDRPARPGAPVASLPDVGRSARENDEP